MQRIMMRFLETSLNHQLAHYFEEQGFGYVVSNWPLRYLDLLKSQPSPFSNLLRHTCNLVIFTKIYHYGSEQRWCDTNVESFSLFVIRSCWSLSKSVANCLSAHHWRLILSLLLLYGHYFGFTQLGNVHKIPLTCNSIYLWKKNSCYTIWFLFPTI